MENILFCAPSKIDLPIQLFENKSFVQFKGEFLRDDSLILIGSIYKTFGQEAREVIVSGVHQKVPEGKVWFLSNQKESKVLFSKTTYDSGSPCNEALYYSPNYTFGIAYYDGSNTGYIRPELVGFTYDSRERVIGSEVYIIKPHLLLKYGENIEESLSWKFEPMETVFLPGMVVFATSCISEITLFEREITESDITAYREKTVQAERLQKIKEQEALERQRERRKEIEAENERKQYLKFNNPNTIYNLAEVSNLQEIKFNTSNQQKIIKNLIGLIKSQDFDELITYPEYKDIKISVQWDSTGSVSDIQIDTENNLKVTQADIDSLKQLLKLSAAPKIKLGEQTRTCAATSLIFKINFLIGESVSAVFKTQRNGYKIYSVRLETKRQIVEDILRESYKSYPVRRKLNLHIYRYSFRFVAEPHLFNSFSNEFERTEWVPFHSVYYPENY